MSLADKVIKNTFYYVLFQLIGFLFPLILTPFIISKIGQIQFGIYAIVLGLIGMFHLLDLSVSSSFIVFISRYYFKKDFDNLNKYFNTGLFFYVSFAIIVAGAGLLFAKPLLNLLNIPPEMFEESLNIYYIGLITFFISGAFTIFSSVLISLQKMYFTSIAGIVIGIIGFMATIILLNQGFGLTGLMIVQLFTVTAVSIVNFYYAMKFIPELKLSISHLGKDPVKEMSKFGAQMQISKIGSFVSEKYDEFLLAYFSVLNNVTFFNIANKISRAGRMVPYQLLPQVAPIASEFKAKEELEKIGVLFVDTSRYLTLISSAVFVFIFIFAELIITTWMGPGYEMSVVILRILIIGQWVNMTMSAPGNSIIPNTGKPKYQMTEGLLYLGINIVLSYVLIKSYGIFGAAIGNTISTIIASTFIFFISTRFFNYGTVSLFSKNYVKPLVSAVTAGIVSFMIYMLSEKYLFGFTGRISGLSYIILLVLIYIAIYLILIIKSKYVRQKDKALFAKIIIKLLVRISPKISNDIASQNENKPHSDLKTKSKIYTLLNPRRYISKLNEIASKPS